MNATTKAIIARLPDKPFLPTGDIAAAFGLKTTDPVISDIKAGKLEAVVIGGRYIISREAAARYVKACECIPTEGTLK